MVRSLVVLSAVVVLSGCPTLPPPSMEVVKASIGPSGGSLEHPQGAKLVVPAGALSSTVELSIAPRTAPSAAELGGTAVGGAFVLGPEGQQFAQPVQVVVPYDPAQLPAGVSASSLEVRISPQDAPNYTSLPTTVDEAARTLTASTTHFSIVVPSATGAAQACTNLTIPPTVIDEQQVAQPGPVPMGGSPVTGIYFVTSRTLYTGAGGTSGPTGRQRRQALRVVVTGATSATLETAEIDVTTNREVRGAGLITINGTELALTRTCPSTDTSVLGFTFANDRLDVIESRSNGIQVTSFTRQASLDAGVDDGGVMGACASVPLVGPVTIDQQVAAAAPVATGGVIESGTFVRVGATVYTGAGGATGPTGSSRQQTLGVVATSATTARLEDTTRRNQGATEFRAYSLTASGTQLTLNLTCPNAGTTISVGYSLSGDRLDVFENASAGTRVTTYLKLLADGGVPAWDAGVPMGTDAGTTADAGTGVDAGTMTGDAGTSGWVTLATGLTDLVDLDLDSTHFYTLGGGEVRKCPLAGCGSNTTLVTGLFASSIAVDNGTLWATTNFRTVETCSLSGTCTLAQQADLGQNSYPAHLWVANSRVYWLWESGSSRRISVCPSAGCTTGYPKTVYSGAGLDGVPASGLVVTATDAYVTSFVGGVYRLPLTDAETATGTATRVLDTGYGTGGFEADAMYARWGNVSDNTMSQCLLPACSSATAILPALTAPGALRSDATHLYAATRGQSNGSGGWVAGTATVRRITK